MTRMAVETARPNSGVTTSVAPLVPPDSNLASISGASSGESGSTFPRFSTSAVSNPLEEANRAYEAQDWAAARSGFDRWLSQHSGGDNKQVSIVLLKAATCASNARDSDACMGYVTDFDRQCAGSFGTPPDYSTTWAMLGLARKNSEREDYGLTERLIQAALNAYPKGRNAADRNVVFMKMELSRVYADNNRTAEAISLMRECVQQAQEWPDVVSSIRENLDRVSGGPRLGPGNWPGNGPGVGPGGISPLPPNDGQFGGRRQPPFGSSF